jgi:hypothetical protein
MLLSSVAMSVAMGAGFLKAVRKKRSRGFHSWWETIQHPSAYRRISASHQIKTSLNLLQATRQGGAKSCSKGVSSLYREIAAASYSNVSGLNSGRGYWYCLYDARPDVSTAASKEVRATRGASGDAGRAGGDL